MQYVAGQIASLGGTPTLAQIAAFPVPLVSVTDANHQRSMKFESGETSFVPPVLSKPGLPVGLLWKGVDGVSVNPPPLSFETSRQLVLQGVHPSTNISANLAGLLIQGDNLEVMQTLIPEFRGKLDLVYIDPPFNVNRAGNGHLHVPMGIPQQELQLVDERVLKGQRDFDFYSLMYERLILIRELMSDKSSIYVHVNVENSGQMKLLLDEVFGSDRRRAQIVRVTGTGKTRTNTFGEIHDVVLFYSKTETYPFLAPRRALTEAEISKNYPHVDEATGRRYALQNLYAPGEQEKGKPLKTFAGEPMAPPRGKHWCFSQKRINEMMARDEIVIHKRQDGTVRIYYKSFYTLKGAMKLQTVWTDCPQTKSPKYQYPTVKPDRFLERLVLASSNQGDWVADFFGGSGSFAAAAMRYGRHFISVDYSALALEVAQKRLTDAQINLRKLGIPLGAVQVFSLGD